MILKNGSNIKEICSYLETLSEDDFISDVIIPIFRNYGYLLLRIIQHGPGEHGKDIIFYKNVPLFYGNEYIVVQAKSEKVTAGNVVKFSQQLIRALKTPFKGNSGIGDNFANYVIFANSKKITSDAQWEFPYLTDSKDNIKKLGQDNIAELMIINSIIPEEIKSNLFSYDETAHNDINSEIQNILFKNKAKEIENLFDNGLAISRSEISESTKQMIIEYIFNLWDQDPSWSGAVKPMKWLDKYYDFLSEKQYKYLEKVLVEYTSSMPSFDAQQYTNSIVKKITKEQILFLEDKFIKMVIEKALYEAYSLYDIIISKNVKEQLKPENQSIIDKIEKLKTLNFSDSSADDEEKKIKRELKEVLWD